MPNYDFHHLLSAFEFECFTRDLINVHEGLDLCSFAEGRDGGIDLRYSYGRGKSVIVQAKRYKSFSELKSKLTAEADKVKKLNPSRYILSTSADLTAANKDEIMNLFSPYIKNDRDILAMQDLNKILAQHPDVERQYYKLWLASTAVLDNIVHKNIVNWTSFQRDDIEKTVRSYVMNQSFNEALGKLLNNHYVVISGEPGIGKTTLARMLVMHLLSGFFMEQPQLEAFDEFFYTSANVEDFAKVFQEGKRQLFFFDDFLGQISLVQGEKNFDKRIVEFIRACRTKEDKLFILTTREYILQQALVLYPTFKNGKGIEFSKCVVDMGKYTRFVRAQIFYNHLVANRIPQPYINAILQDKNYLKIIDHPHFSPRIIETFISRGVHEQCQPDEYFPRIAGFFNHPDSVWLEAFQQLPENARSALQVLNTMGTPVMLSDWKSAFDFFYSRTHTNPNYISEHDWNDIVKSLQNNFIKTDSGAEGIYVDYHNPGIKDVMVRYISADNNLKRVLLDNAYFVEQIFGVFTTSGKGYARPRVPSDCFDLFATSFERIWKEYRSCRMGLNKQLGKKDFYASRPLSRIGVLWRIFSQHKELTDAMPDFFESKATQDLLQNENEGSLDEQLSLLEKLDLERTSLDADALFHSYLNRLEDSADCLNLASSIETVFPQHIDYLQSDEFLGITVENLQQEKANAKDAGIEELDDTTKELCKYIPGLEDEPIVDDISKMSADYNDYLESMAEAYEDDYRYGYREEYGEDASAIDNLFGTIRENA